MTGARALGTSMAEFITLMAFLMALTALSVDIMLVVLPDIAEDFSLTDPNMQQFVVTAYLGAFAAGHILAGPLSDRWGRKPVIIAGLIVYIAGSALAIVAQSYEVLLAARVIQGLGAAGPRVVAVAVIRDRFVGRAMSQVMSFVMMIFIMLPVIAPALGSVIARLGSWHPIFTFLLMFAVGTMIWVAFRLVETNPRRGPDVAPVVPIREAIATICASGQTVGYMLSLGFVFGCLMTYISTAQQFFSDIYGVVDWFPAVFASAAGAMIVSSVVNSRLVGRVGMRRLSHGALVAFVVLTGAVNLVALVVPVVPLGVLMGFMALTFFLIGLILPNFNALSMEPLGRIAGTGSSFVGFVMTGTGAVLGGAVGQLYDGSMHPLFLGWLIYGSISLAIVFVAEGGRLLEPAAVRSPAE